LQKAVKANLLDHFYDHLEEGDWLAGVDLYQAGRVLDLSTYEGLVSGRVMAMSAGSAEVRLKIHPSGHCIQWIECTCRKNRALGQYCEHIAAFMIHVDRERPELFKGLDTTMPLKPPVAPRQKRATAADIASKSGAERDRGAGAAQTIIDHLKGNIQSVSLLAHGPTMRVRIEIKPGTLTHYDLPLDAAASFLAGRAGQADLMGASDEVRALRVHDSVVELGTRLYQPEPEKIVAERVVALRLKSAKARAEAESATTLSLETGKYKRVAADAPDGEEDTFQLIPLKTAAKYLGDQWFFLPGRGYFPLRRSPGAFDDLPLTRTFKEDEAATFARDNFRDYVAAGPIYLDEHLKNPVILDAPELAEVAILSEGDGWFRLDPRYGRGKASVSMVELMKEFRKKRRQYVRAGDAWLKIPEFVTEHNWELDESGEAIKVDALGLLRFKAALGDFDAFVGSKKVLNQIRNRLEFTADSAVPAPRADTRLNLRHYQETGVQWLWWLYQNSLHGLLADEMGLGKTHQAMALMSAIQSEKADARFLVICPTTVLEHWRDKVEQYAPNLKPLAYHGPKRLQHLKDLERGHYNMMITSYGVLLRDIRHLSAKPWEALILDEAHFVKNNDTATYQAACKVPSKLRVCLTGTPMENHLGELKNLFDFLVPGFLGSDAYFRKNFLSPLESGEHPEVTLALQKLIHPFKLRRTKEQVLPDLPAKVEDLRHCALSEEQVKLYRDVVAMKARPLIEKLKDESSPIPYLHVFATLTLLKQICNHPALVDRTNPDKAGASGKARDWRKHESGKFELLKELLDEAIGSDHKVVIFSQYVGMIEIITEYLTEKGIGHVALTGQTKNRGEVIKRFQTQPELKVFCGSLLAGGIGIDLTAASVVIHYDRWWNASKENQATDRVHRIGQNKNVQVLKLVARGTLEEKIDRMIQSKQALFEKFLDKDEELFKALSRQELIELLE